MAHTMLSSRFKIGTFDCISHFFSGQATHSQADLDDTVFADTFKNRIGGLQDFNMAVQFHDDLTDNDLDETIFAIWASNASAIKFGFLQSFTPTAANPEYQATMFLSNDQSGGAIGTEANRSLTFLMQAGVLTRAVS